MKLDLSKLSFSNPAGQIHTKLLELFDRDFYLRQLGEDGFDGGDALAHYLNVGWRDGHDPSPLFSTNGYLACHTDVRARELCPLIHYVQWGFGEKRSIPQSAMHHPQGNRLVGDDQFDTEQVNRVVAKEFDSDFYLKTSPDLEGTALSPLDHFLQHGWKEWRDPCSSFSTSFYLETNDDVRDAGINPFFHFLTKGREEGRQATSHNAEDEHELRITAEKTILGSEFDQDYYLSSNPDLVGYDGPAIEHFLKHGWLEHRDPSPFFSIRHYLSTYTDIASAGINPFVHYIAYGRLEGRSGLPYSQSLALKPFQPLVSVIIPNYNHARFLPQRIESVLNQQYSNIEILVLDDLSIDASELIILDYQRRYPERIRYLPNKTKSSGVFDQWKKGLREAKGDLIWVCESDDFCEPTLLHKLVAPFRDPSVTLSFGRIQFCEEDGTFRPGLDQYRESAQPALWSKSFQLPAGTLFKGPFAKANIVPNVGGCLFRNVHIPEAVWTELLTYKIVGDWFFYAVISAGGQIAYVEDAVAYFRQHSANTSVKGAQGRKYYQEHMDILCFLKARWGVDDEVCSVAYQRLYQTFKHANAQKSIGPLSVVYSNDKVLATPRTNFHILFAIYGFHLGGGEIFPIHLANHFVDSGLMVSMIVLAGLGEDPNVRALLDPRIPIYDTRALQEHGVGHFLSSMQVDLIHSHNAGLEFFFFSNNRIAADIPYVVTLHGSYEVTDFSPSFIEVLIAKVAHWVYLSPKNLSKLAAVPPHRVTCIPNGSPSTSLKGTIERGDLGISSNDIVFALASRAIPEKGWVIAAKALIEAQTKAASPLHLLLCGTGPEGSVIDRDFSDNGNIHNLGFQSDVEGIFRLADVVILPSRFAGESLPLVLIQGLQAGRMIIATDVGEIADLIHSALGSAGMTIALEQDDDLFQSSLTNAMLIACSKEVRDDYASVAARRAADYSMDRAAERYKEIYATCIPGFKA